jgi:hypothetical protein
MAGRPIDGDELLTPSEVAAVSRGPQDGTRWAKAGKLTSIRTWVATAAIGPARSTRCWTALRVCARGTARVVDTRQPQPAAAARSRCAPPPRPAPACLGSPAPPSVPARPPLAPSTCRALATPRAADPFHHRSRPPGRLRHFYNSSFPGAQEGGPLLPRRPISCESDICCINARPAAPGTRPVPRVHRDRRAPPLVESLIDRGHRLERGLRHEAPLRHTCSAPAAPSRSPRPGGRRRQVVGLLQGLPKVDAVVVADAGECPGFWFMALSRSNTAITKLEIGRNKVSRGTIGAGSPAPEHHGRRTNMVYANLFTGSSLWTTIRCMPGRSGASPGWETRTSRWWGSTRLGVHHRCQVRLRNGTPGTSRRSRPGCPDGRCLPPPRHPEPPAPQGFRRTW